MEPWKKPPKSMPDSTEAPVTEPSDPAVGTLEEVLWDSGERHKGLMENMPFPVRFFELDEAGRLIFTGANPEADRLFQVDHKLLIGSPVDEAFPNLVNTLIPERHIRSIQEDEPWQATVAFYRDGDLAGFYTLHAFLVTAHTLAVMLCKVPEHFDAKRKATVAHKNGVKCDDDDILELHINRGDVQEIVERQSGRTIEEESGFPEIIPSRDSEHFRFTDLFSPEDLQAIQDSYAVATNIGSIICDPDGRPITRPSNFCRLCRDVIRNTPTGYFNCMASDAYLGRPSQSGPKMRPCLSGGLWDGGASICVGDRHIASWLVGQVRTEEVDNDKLMLYAREIGADETEFIEALGEVPYMPKHQFEEVCNALFWFANQISQLALQNVLQNRAIAARQQAEAALRQSRARLHMWSGKLIMAQEEERKQLAIELHDGIGQSLTAAKYCVDNITQVLAQGGSPGEALQSASSILKSSIQDVRRMQAELRPQMLDELGVLETMKWFCQEYRKIYRRVRVELRLETKEHGIPGLLKPVIFRICQEAMNNSAKHSGASSIKVGLRRENDGLSLVIVDNGEGFDPEQVLADHHWRRGLGLESMRKRAEVIGGKFKISSKSGQGTRVSAHWVL